MLGHEPTPALSLVPSMPSESFCPHFSAKIQFPVYAKPSLQLVVVGLEQKAGGGVEGNAGQPVAQQRFGGSERGR